MAEKPAKKGKRLVKNPETFRERAVKAAQNADQPGRASGLRRSTGKAANQFFVPFGRGLRIIFGTKLFSPLGKVLRLIGKVIFPAYFRNSWRELKLVTWPSWRESRRLTFAVLIFAIIFGTAIALVDYGLDKVFKDILLK